MKLSISNETVEYILDTFGNLYLKHNGVLYDFVIGMDDFLNIEPLPLHYEINMVEAKGEYEGKLGLLSDPKSLEDHINIINDVTNYKHTNDEVEEKYYYENAMYDENNYDDDYEYDNEESVIFLYTNSDNKETKIIELSDSTALYDIIVHNTDLLSNDIVMKTKLINQIPIYRINICRDTTISFRAIGGKEYLYDIQLHDNNELGLVIREYYSDK